MMIRFRRGTRVMWAHHDRLAVVGQTLVEYKNPSMDQEKVLAALQLGVPELGLDQQAQMIGVAASLLSEMLAQLNPNLISTSPDRRNVNFQLRMAELNRFELDSGTNATELSKRRRNWVMLPSGAESAVRAITPLFNSSGIRVKQSARGWRLDEDGPEYGGWQFSHRVGSVSSKDRHIAIGFFQEQIDPEVYRHWMSRGYIHVAVVFTQFGARVSRLVRPGVEPCLDCDPNFQSVAGSSRASLYFQALNTPLSLDDSRSVAWANSMVLSRVLDWIDYDKVTNQHSFERQLGESNETERFDCGCLLDNFEFNQLEEARFGGASTETVWIGKSDEKV